MPRNLDLTALRSFVAVADTGGVTKASSLLNLTQSAVSMQLKRLEENLGQALLDRSGRGIALTSSGEQLLSYGRRLLELNDEVYGRMTDNAYVGELILGVPHDIVYPSIPPVLHMFNSEFPRMRIQLQSHHTAALKRQYANGELNMILTTEQECDPGGEMLVEKQLQWHGAPGATAWQQRPVPIASEPICAFRRPMINALDGAEIPWTLAVESESSRTIEATVAADLAIMAQISGTAAPHLLPIAHNGALPELGSFKINLYVRETNNAPVVQFLAGLVRRAFEAPTLALTG